MTKLVSLLRLPKNNSTADSLPNTVKLNQRHNSGSLQMFISTTKQLEELEELHLLEAKLESLAETLGQLIPDTTLANQLWTEPKIRKKAVNKHALLNLEPKF